MLIPLAIVVQWSCCALLCREICRLCYLSVIDVTRLTSSMTSCRCRQVRRAGNSAERVGARGGWGGGGASQLAVDGVTPASR